jgi:RNA polymerase sigma factor for flagellar operon FliA
MAQAQKKSLSLERRDRLVLAHIHLVRVIALRVYDELPASIVLDDLISAGTFGLLDAAMKYQPGKKVPFPSYAKYRIRGAILDSLRQSDWASRESRHQMKRIEEARQELEKDLGRAATEDELAQKLSINLEQWRELTVKLAGVLGAPLSLSTRRSETHHDLPEVPGPDQWRPDVMFFRTELRAAIHGALQSLSPRYQKLIDLYYGKQLSMKEIGAILGVNESRVCQMHRRALEIMRSAMMTAGIDSPGALAAAA